MRNYEALIVFNMKGTESTVEDLTKAVAATMQEEGAQIQDIVNAGRREFAYESHHLTAGQYITYTFSAEPSAIRTIREQLRLNPQIHLQYYKLVD
jgi:small subunit ribosomal protein S6